MDDNGALQRAMVVVYSMWLRREPSHPSIVRMVVVRSAGLTAVAVLMMQAEVVELALMDIESVVSA